MSKHAGVNIHIETTECDKLSKVAPDSQKIGEFLDWLQDEREPRLTLCRFVEEEGSDGYFPDHGSIQNLLAEYFKIDMDQVERERAAILDGLRASHSTTKIAAVKS